MEADQQEQVKQLSDQLVTNQEPVGVQRTASETLLSHPPKKRSWWWLELWSDKRELVKEAIAHSVVFAGLLGSLEGAHRLLRWSTLPAEELHLFDKLHFYMHAIILVIFASSFIVKTLKLEFSARKE